MVTDSKPKPMNGGDGDSILIGSANADRLHGGNGDDMAIYSRQSNDDGRGSPLNFQAT